MPVQPAVRQTGREDEVGKKKKMHPRCADDDDKKKAAFTVM
jgi:hypothetical protein